MQAILAVETWFERAHSRMMTAEATFEEHQPSAPMSRPARRVATSSGKDEGFVPVCTLVIWTTCLLIGIVGSLIAYAPPSAPPSEAPPIVAQVLDVELVADNGAHVPEASPPQNLMPPPLAPPAFPDAPPPITVAAPSPQIAFAVPIKAPANVVPAEHASFRNLDTPAPETLVAPALVRPLTFGQGEGRQPAPDYPRAALREGQEGVVTVRLSVDPDGRVLEAEAFHPCPWPLLNDAAVRVVKSRWRFAPGLARLYEVVIRFQIDK